MSLLGNIIWLIFGGLAVGAGYIIGGLAMQRGLGGFPHERLHQDRDLSDYYWHPLWNTGYQAGHRYSGTIWQNH
nr:YccF domain-containing protein [Moorena sp. SIO4G3]